MKIVAAMLLSLLVGISTSTQDCLPGKKIVFLFILQETDNHKHAVIILDSNHLSLLFVHYWKYKFLRLIKVTYT